MTAVVVQLRKRIPSSQTWTNQEIAEFYRVTELLGQAGLAVGLDGGVTDEGDVWQVFFREDTGDVLAHFAKIDGDYVIAIPATGDVLRGTDLREMIASMMDRQPALMARAQKSKGNVHLHPTMMLSSFIVMIYLLAVESSEAVAADAVADAMVLAVQAIAADEAAAREDSDSGSDAAAAADMAQANTAPDMAAPGAADVTVTNDMPVLQRALPVADDFYDDEDDVAGLPADMQSMVISVSIGQNPTLSTVSTAAAQTVLIKKLESPAYVERFSSTMTAVVAAAASILAAGNHDEEFGGISSGELLLAEFQPTTSDDSKSVADREVVLASLDHQDAGSNHSGTSLVPQDQKTQASLTSAQVPAGEAAVASIKLSLPGVVAVDRSAVHAASAVTATSGQQGAVALEGFSVAVAPKSQPAQKAQAAVQTQPAVAGEGAAAPVASPAQSSTPASEKSEPQLAKDSNGTGSAPVADNQPAKPAAEPIKVAIPEHLIELKFQVIQPVDQIGSDRFVILPVDLEDFPTIIDDLNEGGKDDQNGDDQAGDGKTGDGNGSELISDGEVRILPVDEKVEIAQISVAHFAHAEVPLDLTGSVGEDVVIYSGGRITIHGFEMGVDRLVLEDIAVSQDFTAHWIGQGVLKLEFGSGDSITMVGLVVEGLAL